MTEKKDNIYASQLSEVADFSFDRHVADVFDDMLHRSIPGYDAVLHQVGSFASRYIKPHTNIYDLGCSLGAATFAIRNHVNEPGCKIVAVDLSEDMISRFKRRLDRHVGVLPVETQCKDIAEIAIANASFAVMNFTLQFVETAQKEQIVQRIFDGLIDGGALLLSEKTVFSSSEAQQFIEEAYFDLKRHNGYNDLEISQKRDALENVLRLETSKMHLERLARIGFSTRMQWYQNLNFASFIAIK